MSRAALVLLAVVLITTSQAAEPAMATLRFEITDVHVGSIKAERQVEIGSRFTFDDLVEGNPEAHGTTLVSGFCDRDDTGLAIIAHRVTVVDGGIVRNDWFRQTVDPATDADRWTAGSVSLGTVTIFDIRVTGIDPAKDQ